MKQKGFSLIELIVVVMIIGILAAVAVVGLTRQQRQARDTRRKADLATINNGLQSYIAAKYEPPQVATYTQPDNGGWDYSSQRGGVFVTTGDTDFLKFLKADNFLATVPRDPVNNGTGDVHAYGRTDYAYGYIYYFDNVGNDINGYTTYQLNARLETDNGLIGPGKDKSIAVRVFSLGVPVHKR